MTKVIAVLALACAILLIYRTFASFVAYSKLSVHGESPKFTMLSLPGYLWAVYRMHTGDDTSLRKLLRNIIVADVVLLVLAFAIVICFQTIQ